MKCLFRFIAWSTYCVMSSFMAVGHLDSSSWAFVLPSWSSLHHSQHFHNLLYLHRELQQAAGEFQQDELSAFRNRQNYWLTCQGLKQSNSTTSRDVKHNGGTVSVWPTMASCEWTSCDKICRHDAPSVFPFKNDPCKLCFLLALTNENWKKLVRYINFRCGHFFINKLWKTGEEKCWIIVDTVAEREGKKR